MLKVCTWNVNGLRKREVDVLEFMAREQPDVLCLQEIKAAPDQLPDSLRVPAGYHAYLHGRPGLFRGRALHGTRGLPAAACVPPPRVRPRDPHRDRRVPAVRDRFDLRAERRQGLSRQGALPRRARRLRCARPGERQDADPVRRSQRRARTARRAPVAAKPAAAGPDPRRARAVRAHREPRPFDLSRLFHPEDDQLFTWWAPWRNQRERNIGWRIDYVLASASLSERALSCEAQREFGTSDHGPLTATFAIDPPAAWWPTPSRSPNRNPRRRRTASCRSSDGVGSRLRLRATSGRRLSRAPPHDLALDPVPLADRARVLDRTVRGARVAAVRRAGADAGLSDLRRAPLAPVRRVLGGVQLSPRERRLLPSAHRLEQRPLGRDGHGAADPRLRDPRRDAPVRRRPERRAGHVVGAVHAGARWLPRGPVAPCRRRVRAARVRYAGAFADGAVRAATDPARRRDGADGRRGRDAVRARVAHRAQARLRRGARAVHDRHLAEGPGGRGRAVDGVLRRGAQAGAVSGFRAARAAAADSARPLARVVRMGAPPERGLQRRPRLLCDRRQEGG